EDDLGRPLLGDAEAGPEVADDALDDERAGVGAEGGVAVQLDGAGPGVVAGDVEQGAVVGRARPVEAQDLVDGAGDVLDVGLAGLPDGAEDGGGVGAVAEGLGVLDVEGALDHRDGAGEAAVVVGQDEGAGAVLAQVHPGGALEVAVDGQVGAGGADGEEL